MGEEDCVGDEGVRLFRFRYGCYWCVIECGDVCGVIGGGVEKCDG